MFFRRRRSAVVVAFTLGVFLAGCKSDKPSAANARYAIRAVENLTADKDLDWAARALSDLVVTSASTGSGIQILSGNETNLAFASQQVEALLRGNPKALQLQVHVWDRATSKQTSSFELAGTTAALPKLAAELVGRIGGKPEDVRVKAESLEKLYRGLAITDRSMALASFDSILAEDPSYGAARLARIDALQSLGRRDEAKADMRLASQTPGNLTEEEKARIALFSATVDGNLQSRSSAASRIAALKRGDLDAWRTSADLALAARQFAKATESFQQAAAIDPGNPQVWNLLGYSQAYEGDLPAAIRSLEKYRALAPNEPNVSDSLGEVHFLHGKFDEAARYFAEAFDKSPNLLGGGEAYRAAVSKLMAGDRAGADKFFEQYLAHRTTLKDTLIPVRRALWLFQKGSRTQAIEALKQIDSPAQAAVPSLLVRVLWALELGQGEEARLLAEQAAPSASLSNLARFLVKPPAPGEPQPTSGDATTRKILGYRALLHKDSSVAKRIWQQLFESTPGNAANEERTMLAWAEAQNGNLGAVGKLMKLHSLPGTGAEPGFSVLHFPRSIYLKALAEQEAGNRNEAKRLFALFFEYSPERPFVYGEEATAAQFVSNSK